MKWKEWYFGAVLSAILVTGCIVIGLKNGIS